MAESLDGKCPYCRSDYVVKTGSFGDHISQDKMENEGDITYKCYTCNKEFYCNLED
jgi:DNA-directed RNA polymerase subunit RPC12/RpoP